MTLGGAEWFLLRSPELGAAGHGQKGGRALADAREGLLSQYN